MTIKSVFSFTKQSVAKIKATDKRQYFYDTKNPQLGLTVQPSGTKSFFVRTTINGVTKRIGLKPGKFPGVTPDLARAAAAKILADAAGGVNTIEKRRHKKQADITLSEVLEAYLSAKRNKGLPLKDNTKRDYRDAIHESFDDYIDKPMRNITEGVVLKVHAVRSKESLARCDNSMRVLRALFNWAKRQYKTGKGSMFPDNPTEVLKDSGLWYKAPRKQSYVMAEHLSDWFNAIEQQPVHVREFFEFLILTGTRASEASTLEWNAVDFKTRTFNLYDTKNRKEVVTLPLPDYIITRLKQRAQKSGRVFPVSVRKSKSKHDGIIKYSYARDELESLKLASGINHSVHDLRRTFSTFADPVMGSVTLKRLLNHMTSGDVTAGYVIPRVDKLREAQQAANKEILIEANRYKPEFLTLVNQ